MGSTGQECQAAGSRDRAAGSAVTAGEGVDEGSRVAVGSEGPISTRGTVGASVGGGASSGAGGSVGEGWEVRLGRAAGVAVGDVEKKGWQAASKSRKVNAS